MLPTACKKSEWDRLHLPVVVAITTGARRGELLDLRWADIEFNKLTATLHQTKDGEDRIHFTLCANRLPA